MNNRDNGRANPPEVVDNTMQIIHKLLYFYTLEDGQIAKLIASKFRIFLLLQKSVVVSTCTNISLPSVLLSDSGKCMLAVQCELSVK